MAEVRWIKLYIDIWNNRKIKQIETLPDGDAMLIIWLKLLTLAANINDGGLVYFTSDIPFNESMLANEFGRPLETVRMALSVFQKFGMIEVVNDMIFVSNWEKYQALDQAERTREQTRQRVTAYRERKKLGCNVTGNVTVTQCNALDKDKDTDKDIKEKSIKEKSSRFVPPTLEEIHRYCWDKGLMVDEQTFFDYYNESDWVDSKGNKVKNWKQKLITWAKHDRGNAKPKFSAKEMEVEELDINEIRRGLGLPEVET